MECENKTNKQKSNEKPTNKQNVEIHCLGNGVPERLAVFEILTIFDHIFFSTYVVS